MVRGITTLGFHVTSSINLPNVASFKLAAFQSAISFDICSPSIKQTCHLQRRRSMPQMLRVQKKRRPENWDEKLSKLSGRFLPMDPRDETILDLLEKDKRLPDLDYDYGPEGPTREAYGESSIGRSTPSKWSRRSEAARKRWADPCYRAKMLEKRKAKRKMNEEANGGSKQKVQIGRMDSITLCDDDKAKAINDYARSNKLRSEKISAFHRNRRLWMEERLNSGQSQAKLSDEEYVNKKLQIQQKRREVALRRARNMRAQRLKRENDEDAHEG